MGALTPRVWLLDLQGNLLCDWQELAAMCRQLPRLSQLRINGNRMHMPTLYRPSLALPPSGGAFRRLKVMVLNSCGITSWKQVALLEKGLPVVEQLSLAYNDLSDLEPSLLHLESLRGEADTISPTAIAAAAAAVPFQGQDGEDGEGAGGLGTETWTAFVEQANINAEWLVANCGGASSGGDNAAGAAAAMAAVVLENPGGRFPCVRGFAKLNHLDMSNVSHFCGN